MSTHRKAYLEITNRCNLSCAFCPGTERRAHVMTEDEFIFLAKRLSSWAEYLYKAPRDATSLGAFYIRTIWTFLCFRLLIAIEGYIQKICSKSQKN